VCAGFDTFLVFPAKGYISETGDIGYLSENENDSTYLNDILHFQNMYGFIDSNGKEVVPLKYIEANSYSEGFALVGTRYGSNNATQYGYIDMGGNEIIPCQFADAHNFINGYASVAMNIAEEIWNEKSNVTQNVFKQKWGIIYIG
jgi:hypothetical protein